MRAQTYSETRANFRSAMQSVTDNHEHLLITSKSGDVVMMSKQDYDSMEETMHLLSSKNNTKRLMDSIEQIEEEGL